ncbi:Hypothetical predicted protein [Octopus vulgaris]|uniref:Uncharacterized protein n=1 Tax=Octopus vulgaris TaxID=6645 RepID=A0AA36BA80_OCTVU|nr:Hypothetical predicted protein [Octopus vulgaris]
MVNYIKKRPLKCRLFEQICVDIDSQHKRLLLHTNVRWLSKVQNSARHFQSLDPNQHMFNLRSPLFSDDENDDDDSEYQRWILQKPPPVVQFPKERASQPALSSPEPRRYPQLTDIHYTPKERSATCWENLNSCCMRPMRH